MVEVECMTSTLLLTCTTQVVVGARAVLANGGIMGSNGLMAVALAAQRHSVPFVVLTGLHKLSPEQVRRLAATKKLRSVWTGVVGTGNWGMSVHCVL
jgi:translation initiation factor 2B subunit (eIF-2B alpha/beta/delta family)